MLTMEGCRARQQRLRERLDAAGVGGALVSSPRDIYYLTGLLTENVTYPFPSLLYLGTTGASWLATWAAEGEALVDERLTYDFHVMYTMNPDAIARLTALIAGKVGALRGVTRLEFQAESLPFAVGRAVEQAASPREWLPIDATLADLQKRKDADEVVCLRAAIGAVLAGYDRAQQVIAAGVNELDVFAQCQQAAQQHSRRVHYYGGDFQCGSFGGVARDRRIEGGELYIIDAQADVDGYWSDMARTWSVAEPTALQQSVYDHLAGVLRAVPEMARAGRSCTEFWRELDQRIAAHPHLAASGLVHHGGHGVGLRVHEAPDLNRDRDDVFEVGNVFSCEPGGYSDELRHGVRVENTFLITEQGVENLSEYPLTLQPRRG
jgi:Xaa-Pro aminopeptidase